MTEPLFSLENAACGYPRHAAVLTGIDFTVDRGEVVCILGANGAGKSTLFKSILRLLPLVSGRALIEGQDVSSWTNGRMAREIGYIPQATSLAFAYSALDVILMGRAAATGLFGSPSEADEELAYGLARDLGIQNLINRNFRELSGGERQLVIIARALAQQPRMLVMDEPTAALDFGNQQLVLGQVSRLASRGLSIVMASHYPDHAFMYADRAILIKDGGIYAEGAPESVITEKSLKDLYGVDAAIVETGIHARASGGREIKVAVPLGG